MSATLDKMSKILKLAENASTQEEADAYFSKAQKFATMSGIELSVARAHQANKEKRSAPISRRIKIGEKGTHGLVHFIQLFSGIASANDVKIDIYRSKTAVIAYGFESDIEVVEALFASLLFQMQSSCAAFIKSGAFKSETTYGYSKREGTYVAKPVHGSTARNSFQESFVHEVSTRLYKAKLEAQTKAKSDSAAAEHTDVASSSVSLVLVSKQDEVADFYKGTSNARGSFSAKSSSSYSLSGSRAGKSAGSSANFGTNKAIGGSRTAIR